MLLGGKRCVNLSIIVSKHLFLTPPLYQPALQAARLHVLPITFPQEERRNKYIAFCYHSPCLQALFLHLLETLPSCSLSAFSPGARQAATGEQETEQEGKEPVTRTGWAIEGCSAATTWPQPVALPEGEHPVQPLGIWQAEEGGNQTFLLPPEGPGCPPSQGQCGYLYLATLSPFLSCTGKPVC